MISQLQDEPVAAKLPAMQARVVHVQCGSQGRHTLEIGIWDRKVCLGRRRHDSEHGFDVRRWIGASPA